MCFSGSSISTAVSNADVVRLIADLKGRLIIQPHVPRERIVQNRIVLTTTTETTLIAAGGAGVFRDIVGFIISNGSNSDVQVDIRDSTGGTIRVTLTAAKAGGGASIMMPVQLPQATANNNWTAKLASAVSSVFITAIAIEDA